jgi:hypothetical protein
MSVHTALKPYATAGVAIVGAGVLAVTPTAAPSPDLSTVRDFALTADGSPFGDFLAPWLDQYNTAAENTTQLANNFFVAPWVGLQQALANQGDFWQQLADDPTTLGEVTLAMQDNVKAVLDSFTLLGADDDTVAAVINHTLSGEGDPISQHDLVGLLPQLVEGGLLPLPEGTDPDLVIEVVNFLSSPASGILIGALGPAISPVVALMNSITDGDGFNEILANMGGAFFNGATLNLDFVLPMIDDADVLPEGMSVDHLEFAFGGLLTAGDVNNAPYSFFDDSGNLVNEVPAVGGSILNGLGIEIDGVPALNEIAFDGHGVGPIAAWQGFSQAIAGLLGADAWNWDGKNGGTPPPADPPLSGGSFPLIDDDFFDGSTIPDADAGAAAADAADAMSLADLLAAFGV